MRSPFKFLDAFTLKDKDAFFGRDQEIDTMYSVIFKTPLLLVYGLSGTGKTSVIQCGLASRFEGPDWYPLFIRRNDNINKSVAAVMRNVLGNEAQDNLTANVSMLLRKSLRPVYLLFDQFEELFILGKEEEQKAFMGALRELLDAQLPAKIILIMREEYIAQLYSYEALIPELFDHRLRIEPMGPGKVKEVISSSFDKFNINLAEPRVELLDLMVHNISDPRTGITLPYLQVYLDMLYRDKYLRQYGKVEPEGYPNLDITKSDIEGIGRIDNVLERFLEDQLLELRKDLVEKYKTVKKGTIMSVLDVFVSEEGTKRPVAYTQPDKDIILTEESASTLRDIPAEMLTHILTVMHQDRILRRGDDYFELAHDSLAQVIDSRRSESQRQLQNIRKRLVNAFDEYQKTGAFLNQKQLAAFDEYRFQLGLSAELEKFLDTCEEEVTRLARIEQERLQQENQMAQQKKLARIRGILMVLAIILAGGAVASTIYMNKQGTILKQQKKISDSALAETDSLYTKLLFDSDSIKGIVHEVDSLISILDLMAENANSVESFEVAKIIMSMKRALQHDTLSDKEMAENYITLKDIFITNEIPSNRDLAQAVRDTILKSFTAHVVLQLAVPRDKHDFIEIKWLKENGELVGNPNYIMIKPSGLFDDGLKWISDAMDIDEFGKYRVNITNGSGKLIGSTHFNLGKRIEVADTLDKPAETNTNELRVNRFITMASGNLNMPGDEVKTFKVGQMIHYWFSINSPKAGEVLLVSLIDENKNTIWNDRFTTQVNTGTGYRGWKYHGARAPGKYTLIVMTENKKVLWEATVSIE